MSTQFNTIGTARWGVRIALILIIMAVMTSSGLAQEDPHRAASLPPDFSLEGGTNQAVLPDPIGSGLLHVNGMAFKPNVSTAPYEYVGVALGNPGGTPFDYHAAINLPHGAEIKKVIFIYYDNNPANDIEMHLSFQPFDYFGYGYLASATSFVYNDLIQYVEVTYFEYSNVIDNENMTYLLNVTIPGGGDLNLISVRIEYSFTNFAPLISR